MGEGEHGAMEGTPAPPRARMTITLLPNGAVHVDFPADPVTAFGMLREADRILARHFDKASTPMIEAPNGGTHPGARGLLGTIKRNLG